jgi:hypothetical protein
VGRPVDPAHVPQHPRRACEQAHRDEQDECADATRHRRQRRSPHRGCQRQARVGLRPRVPLRLLLADVTLVESCSLSGIVDVATSPHAIDISPRNTTSASAWSAYGNPRRRICRSCAAGDGRSEQKRSDCAAPIRAAVQP